MDLGSCSKLRGFSSALVQMKEGKEGNERPNKPKATQNSVNLDFFLLLLGLFRWSPCSGFTFIITPPPSTDQPPVWPHGFATSVPSFLPLSLPPAFLPSSKPQTGSSRSVRVCPPWTSSRLGSFVGWENGVEGRWEERGPVNVTALCAEAFDSVP
ncbi:hypothetical protein IE53DRAFT_385624 [Violaceomyces palustris]|uniref:Uncharacterized protein n=1 Tax=Violaceomyces palustris TaxID=1673888 RepID=A0ACD0P1U8_9BASI|nr:hypothetical protein IE53DRAFT_385624 [Violaceomyces palustris]